MSPGEWAGASTQVITVNTAAGAVPATLYVMNDNLTLYIALKFPESTRNYGSLGVEFDNDNDGVPYEAGDDAVVVNNLLGFFDDFRQPCGPDICAPGDITDGGSSEGRGAYVNDGTNSVYELSHPFKDSDLGHDLPICFINGGIPCSPTVGFFVLLRQIDSSGALHDTYYPDAGVYDQITFHSCPPPTLSGCGTPVINGHIAPGEWSPSGQRRLSVNTTPRGDTTPATLYVMNDAFNFYSALAFDETALTPNQGLSMSFFMSSSTFVWQDLLTLNANTGFEDSWVRQPNLCLNLFCPATDISSGGNRDGLGALANDGVSTAYELSHPLNSGERYDVALAFGDTVPYTAFLSLGAGVGTDVGSLAHWTICTPGPTQNVRDLSQQVDALDRSGALSSKNTDTLRKDLVKANGNLESGKPKQAANDLGNFVNDVTKMMRKGELADRFGQPLVAAANSAMSQL